MTPEDSRDPYFKKRVTLADGGERLEFAVAHTLFATHAVDAGSALLLRTLASEIEHPPRRVLDLGCGYGALGVTLARRWPEAEVVMIDSDLLAVRYARRNAALNGAENAVALGSVGLEQAPAGRFDLIVANVPAKIGEAAIRDEFVYGPRARLTAEGAYWFVAVSGLNHLLKRLAGGEGMALRRMRKRSGHTIYRLGP